MLTAAKRHVLVEEGRGAVVVDVNEEEEVARSSPLSCGAKAVVGLGRRRTTRHATRRQAKGGRCQCHCCCAMISSWCVCVLDVRGGKHMHRDGGRRCLQVSKITSSLQTQNATIFGVIARYSRCVFLV